MLSLSGAPTLHKRERISWRNFSRSSGVIFSQRESLSLLSQTIGSITVVTAKAPEEYPAKKQQPESLPEGDLPPSEKRRRKPVPKMHHYFAEDPSKKRNRERACNKNPRVSLHPAISHFLFLISH